MLRVFFIFFLFFPGVALGQVTMENWNKYMESKKKRGGSIHVAGFKVEHFPGTLGLMISALVHNDDSSSALGSIEMHCEIYGKDKLLYRGRVISEGEVGPGEVKRLDFYVYPSSSSYIRGELIEDKYYNLYLIPRLDFSEIKYYQSSNVLFDCSSPVPFL